MSLRGSATHRSCAHHGVAKKHDVVDVRQEGRRQIHTIVVHSSGADAGEGQAKDKPMGGESRRAVWPVRRAGHVPRLQGPDKRNHLLL